MHKHFRRNLLAAGLLAAAGFTAIAQTPAAPAAAPAPVQQQRGEHGRMDPARAAQLQARMEQHRAKRLGELKQKLQITGAQEGAWTTWTDAMKPAPRQRPDRAAFARMTTPERIDQMRALRAQRNAEMDKRMDATKSFYAALSADQKKTFDHEGGRFLGGKGKRGHGHHGHHGHHGGPRG